MSVLCSVHSPLKFLSLLKWNVTPHILKCGGRYFFAAYFAPSFKLMLCLSVWIVYYCLLALPTYEGGNKGNNSVLGNFSGQNTFSKLLYKSAELDLKLTKVFLGWSTLLSAWIPRQRRRLACESFGDDNFAFCDRSQKWTISF